MTDASQPSNIVIAPKHLSAWKESFMGADGTWPTLLEAQKQLLTTVRRALLTNEYAAYSDAYTAFSLQLNGN